MISVDVIFMFFAFIVLLKKRNFTKCFKIFSFVKCNKK